MAGVRMTGLASGLDTESLVGQLSEAYQKKVDNVKKQQTKAEWKKEAWQSLNTKLMDFYRGALSEFKSYSSYRAKTVSGDLKGMKITAGNNAANGTHKVQVLNTAVAQMWTGKKINTGTYTKTSYEGAKNGDVALSDVKDANGNSMADTLKNAKFTISADGTDYQVDLSTKGYDDNTKIDTIVEDINNQLSGSGATVSFENGAFKITNDSATKTTETDTNGKETTKYEGGHDITIKATDDASAALFGTKAGETGSTIKAATSDKSQNALTGTSRVNVEVKTPDSKVTSATKLSDLNPSLVGKELTVNGQQITIGTNTTLSDVASQISKMGVNANYDQGQGRFYLNASQSGTENGFTIGGDEELISALGLDLKEGDAGRIDAADAKIVYNGVEYEQSSNSFNINGLTIEATEPGEAQTISVGNDAQAVYDKVKNFVKGYNELLSEMNKLYGAERLKDMEPLSDDEKKALGDKDVENWEKKIKDSILRKDDTINSLISTMRNTMMGTIKVTGSDGVERGFTLSSFGIGTGVYSEKGLLHIDGNSDDSDYAGVDDKLMKALMDDPESVEKTLAGLGTQLYNKFQKAMGRQEGVSSAMTFYNDKTMDDDIKGYKEKVTKEQDKMTAAEDKYYKQFAAMESAMAKMQAQQSYVSQLFGNAG
ncbi:MAG: flagellar filament capping protein FliD [Eubacteriales bacterium]|nr:flagellar filament capping protein FliD [Eubacteriales bacterium]